MSGKDKTMSMKEAVARFVKNGDSVYMGGFTQQQPYAAAHEIIRSKISGLTLSTCVGLVLADQMIGAGSIDRLITAFVWNPLPERAHCFSRSISEGIPSRIEIEEYSIFLLNLAYYAGAMGLPYIAAKTALGSSFDTETSPSGAKNRLRFEESPFTGERVCLVPPIVHDVGIIQVQRADQSGNAQAWGILGESRFGMMSCDRIIVCAEEIVSTDVIMRDPNRTILPSFRVSAVVEEPWGAHPSSMAGYYDMDWRYYGYYGRESRSVESFDRYLEKWVRCPSGRQEYVDMLGEERINSLVPETYESDPVSYGRLTGHFEAKDG